jgi:hypothetical protein
MSDIYIFVVVNLNFDILTVGNLTVDILTVGNLIVDKDIVTKSKSMLPCVGVSDACLPRVPIIALQARFTDT